MMRARDEVIRQHLSQIVEPYDREPVSRALSQIAFTVLPDWGELRVETWMVEGLKPIFSHLFELSGPLQVELLECLSLLYNRSGVQPDFDLSELKERLQDLSVAALPYAISIIAHEGPEAAERYLRPLSDHQRRDVREEALEALGMLSHPA